MDIKSEPSVKTATAAVSRVSLQKSEVSKLLSSSSNNTLLSARSIASTPSIAHRASVSSSQELALMHMYCATAKSQQRLQSAGGASKGEDSKLKQNPFDRLAAPAKRPAKRAFGSFDDARNCRFQPKIYSKHSAETKAEEGERKQLGFIDRQEAKLREKRHKLSEAQLISEYAEIHFRDKKYCPKCQALQSYKEHSEKVKRCPRCQVEYIHRTPWQAVAKDFHDRQQQWQKRLEEERAALAAESKTIYRNNWVFDAKAGKYRQEKQACQPKKWADVKNDFLDRLEEHLQQRRGSTDGATHSSTAPPKPRTPRRRHPESTSRKTDTRGETKIGARHGAS